MRGLTKIQREFIDVAKESLFYIQAKRWSTEPPKSAKGAAAKVWTEANKVIVSIVDNDFRLPEDQNKAMRSLLLIMDFGLMLDQYKLQSNEMISRGFDEFIEIMCGKNWKKGFKKAMKVKS